MTNVEAIQHLGYIKEMLKAEMPWEKPLEAVDAAIKAIEKQMPKKVKGKYPFYCPSCGTKVSPGPYCWKCGQRVEFERREVKI